MRAEDLLRKKWSDGGFEMDESNTAWRLCVSAMEEYAHLKCEEQRKACADEYSDKSTGNSYYPRIQKHILNTPNVLNELA